jgi:hypothetical protein
MELFAFNPNHSVFSPEANFQTEQKLLLKEEARKNHSSSTVAFYFNS